MDKESVLDLAKRYSELVRQHLPVKQILLYGSYVKETAHLDSDIDIAVIVEKLKGDYLEEQSKLYKLRRNIDLRIEPILLENGKDSSGFLEDIIATGQIIYSSSIPQ